MSFVRAWLSLQGRWETVEGFDNDNAVIDLYYTDEIMKNKK